MAFGTGKDTNQESNGGFKKYVGLTSVKILALNPTLEEWNKITGGNRQKEIEYCSVAEDGTKQAKITLLVQANKDKTVNGIEPIIPITFIFKKATIQGANSGKFQVIDKYGRTAWVTASEYESKTIPQYSNGPANIDKDYRKIIVGEEVLTNFLKACVGIPALSWKDSKTGEIKTNPNPKDCEARLDNILKIFDGDFKEIKKIIDCQDNYTKVLFGVRTTDDGGEFQDVFMELFHSNSNPRDLDFAKELAKYKAGGRSRYDNTYFGETNANGELIIQPLREYEVKPSEFKDNEATPPTDIFGDPEPPAIQEEEKGDMPF